MVLFFKLLNYFSLKKIIQNKPQSELIIGIFWIILSVIGYSLLPLFGNLAYKSGVVLSTAVFIRFITATFFLEIHSLVQPPKNSAAEIICNRWIFSLKKETPRKR